MRPDGEWQRPSRPARQFPDDSGVPGPVPGEQLVDLVFERSRLLSGSVGGQPVRVAMNVPVLEGSADGIFAGEPVSARWTIASNNSVYPDVPAQLTGTFAGRPAELRAVVHLEPGYFFDRASISGRLADQDLEATAERVSGGLGSTSTIAVDGRAGGTDFTIFAAIDGPLTAGKIRGSLAGIAIRLDATRTRLPGGHRTHVTGRYAGPTDLLALVAGAFLYFI